MTRVLLPPSPRGSRLLGLYEHGSPEAVSVSAAMPAMACGDAEGLRHSDRNLP
ncbi:hypothetical protein [Phormidium sp. CCY1219]|uniref:hypothetical protein n=1 Tax=Phormidium sp. CCY1219 TaxID=2886104 RepID=UPI002D773118|nr:hypothetical protein [Phormidium sp. CCY1219]